MSIDLEQIEHWQDQADAVWDAIQSWLSPFDEIIIPWVEPHIELPPMPEGLLTALSIPVILIGLALIAMIFDMFGTLLLRVTFRYRKQAPFQPSLWAIYDPLSAALKSRYRLLPWVAMNDLIRLDNGSRYQRSVHRFRLLSYHADAVIADKTTGEPAQIILLLPKGRPSRALRKRHRQIGKVCKRARIPLTYLPMHAAASGSYPSSLATYLEEPTPTPAE